MAQKTTFFLTLGNFLNLIGHSPRLLKKFSSAWRFSTEQAKFNALGGTIDCIRPIISEYKEQAGSAQGHYFHQDLLVASFIAQNNPQRHLDVGSRIDGFVAHVAAFRPIEIIDVRTLKDTGHENICFLKANLMDSSQVKDDITDSLSCLHAIEHFGLGRYGDPIDPEGYKKGFNNLIRMLQSGGTLYISFPIGDQNQVQFNAHRIFHPQDIFHWTPSIKQLTLKRFDYVDDAGLLHTNISFDQLPKGIVYGCGIYTFQKN